MRVDGVSVHNFLSHADTSVAFNGERLITVVGANGAGKSSLFVDAPLFTLFDDARGRTDELVRLGSTEMSAQVEFSYAGGRYRVARGRTTRSGGKSWLELAIADGDAWRPLTADSIRETQQAIERLLRMDAATFETAVVLVQGGSMRFAEATPAERKRILGTVLGLDLWERAEARAREAARELDGRCAGDRARAERLRADLEALAGAEDDVEAAGATIADLDAQQAAAEGHRSDAETALRDLAGRVADAEAAVAEESRLDAELLSHRGRWRRATEGRQQATDAIARAQQTLVREAAVTAALEALPGLRERVAGMEADEQQLRAREAELRGWEAREAAAAAEDARRLAAHAAERGALEARLEALRTAQRPCPECGFVDPELRRDLFLTEQALGGFPAPPMESMELGKARGQAERVRGKIAALALDPAAVAALRRDLSETERTAALAGAMEAARQALADGERAVAAADAELEAITEAGRQARLALDAARERAAGMGGLLDDSARWVAVREAATLALAELAQRRQAAAGDLATAQARVAQARLWEAEQAGLDASLSGAETDLRRLRRLVDAFGVRGIPARIIASVLPELEGHANALLADLRPGVSLAVRAQRARKGDGGVTEALDLAVRDDAGERPLALFSGGERMSVSLAIAVALSRLVARRAGTAIRTLVVDEPDGLDADARRSFGAALRVLAHQGELERVVLVSHHPDLADVGDAVYQVTKDGHGSTVEQIA